MAVMENVIRVGKTYKVRKRIPPECRTEFGVTGDFKTVSLNTSDKREAQKLAVPILADIDSRIAEIRAGLAPRRPALALNPTRCFEIIDQWRRDEIAADYDSVFAPDRRERNGSEASSLRYSLQHLSTIDQIETFDGRLADILDVRTNHPAVRNLTVREWFREAWLDIETMHERFSRGDFNGYDGVAPVAIETPAVTPTTTTPTPQAGMKLSELRDAWDKVKPLDPRQKGYIRRLIEHLGDRDIGSITPTHMDGMKLALERFPLTKKPADDRLPFAELLAKYEGTDKARLHVKTVWNWVTTYKGMFAFAVSRRLLDHNPAEHTMPKPSAEAANDRKPYSDADLDFLFTRPMFCGFSGKADTGYRNREGCEIVRDSKYWLPIVALHTGMRLEELASIRKSEIIDQDGVLAFDLTSRPLNGVGSVKNRSARRIVPLHQRLYDLGFVKSMQGQTDYVFPDLRVDSEGKRGSQFSKWWGLWSAANAPKAGQGIDDPALAFHSFRHTFKRAARESSVKEEIHDLLTGHSEGNTVARGYGRGVDLATLKAAMDEIEIRWP